jgi:hypothetical protein
MIFKKRPVTTFFAGILLVVTIYAGWDYIQLVTNPLDPNDPKFNPEYFRFSNYGDPIYREEVSRLVFPKGMPEEEVDDILLIDLFSSKSYRSDIEGHVYYVYVSAPWRLLNKVHSVLYDEKRALVDVFPGNGRGIYSGLQLDQIRQMNKEQKP